MTGFDLPQNIHSDPECFLGGRELVSYHLGDHSRQSIQSSHHRQLLELWPRRHSVIAPSANQVPTGPEVNTGGENFEIKTGLITMVQASPFCGRANEDASAHLQQFLELCSTFVIKSVSQFHSLLGEGQTMVLC